MRRRLLLVLLPLLTALLAALEVPLAQTYGDRLTQDLFLKRSTDVERFAALADPILRSDSGHNTLQAELRTYTGLLPGVTVTVFDNDGGVWVTSPGRPSAGALAARDDSLAELDVNSPKTAWPWRKTPMIVGETIGKRVPIGAVVLEAPTASVRERVGRRIAVLAGGGVAVLLMTSALCALPLSRWLLRPVHDLNAAAGRLAAGDLGARASERGGPPELRGLARVFNQMADNLVAALERQRAFVDDASHELRNPLATLRLRMEALAGKVDGSGERDLRLALDESDRLAHTVKRLLELARAEATAAEQIDVDIVTLTTARLDAWRPALEAAGNELRFDAPTHAAARCSSQAVEYALDVVLDNACTFARGAPVDLTITARAGCVEVVVRDHGPGLTAVEVARVGERFWRSPRHRAVAGTGLGLATARALLKDSGAAMHVASAAPGLQIRLRLAPSSGALADTSAWRQDADQAGTSRSPSAG